MPLARLYRLAGPGHADALHPGQLGHDARRGFLTTAPNGRPLSGHISCLPDAGATAGKHHGVLAALLSYHDGAA